MMAEKLKFPKCEGYGVETLDYGNVSDTHYISFSDQVEKALSKAEQEGAKAFKIHFKEWMKGHGYAVGDKRYIAFDKEELAAELEGRK